MPSQRVMCGPFLRTGAWSTERSDRSGLDVKNRTIGARDLGPVLFIFYTADPISLPLNYRFPTWKIHDSPYSATIRNCYFSSQSRLEPAILIDLPSRLRKVSFSGSQVLTSLARFFCTRIRWAGRVEREGIDHEAGPRGLRSPFTREASLHGRIAARSG